MEMVKVIEAVVSRLNVAVNELKDIRETEKISEEADKRIQVVEKEIGTIITKLINPSGHISFTKNNPDDTDEDRGLETFSIDKE